MCCTIDITQYRSRIGTFAGKKIKCNSVNYNIIESFILLSFLLVLSTVTKTLLIISGVELNPGPFTVGKKYLMGA